MYFKSNLSNYPTIFKQAKQNKSKTKQTLAISYRKTSLYVKPKVNHFCILNCIDISIVYHRLYKPNTHIVFAGELYHEMDMREIIIHTHTDIYIYTYNKPKNKQKNKIKQQKMYKTQKNKYKKY